jgi:hypothetical protein
MSEARSWLATSVMRKIIALRKRDSDDIAEEEAVMEMYKEALACDLDQSHGRRSRYSCARRCGIGPSSTSSVTDDMHRP